MITMELLNTKVLKILEIYLINCINDGINDIKYLFNEIAFNGIAFNER